jgi:hypothetical protein
MAAWQELHGKRRKLHEQLSEICEDFAMATSKEHKQKALVRELQYLSTTTATTPAGRELTDLGTPKPTRRTSWNCRD